MNTFSINCGIFWYIPKTEALYPDPPSHSRTPQYRRPHAVGRPDLPFLSVGPPLSVRRTSPFRPPPPRRLSPPRCIAVCSLRSPPPPFASRLLRSFAAAKSALSLLSPLCSPCTLSRSGPQELLKLLWHQMGGEGEAEGSKKIVFVTVGTTSFDALVKVIDTHQIKEELSRRGYTDLLIQMGRGSYFPSKVTGKDGSLNVDYFTFSPSIADYLKSASLVISHAGSGSIFETLRLGKPLIVVVNEDLMDNHQCELAEELAERKHLYCARPQTLHQTIKTMDLESLLPYQPGDATPVVKMINKFLGFPTD